MPQIVTAATSFLFFGTTTGTLTLFGSAALWKLTASVIALQAATALSGVNKGAAQQQPGIRTQFTGRGETTPQSTIFGQYATSGHAICPQMSHHDPNIDGTRWDYLNGVWQGPVGTGNWHTYVLNIADTPIASLDKIIVNGTQFDLQTDLTDVSPVYGRGIPSNHPTHPEWHERLFVKFYDGTQTAADPYLVAAYGNHPDRPWSATHVHSGGAYVIVTVQRDDRVFDRPPEFRFVVTGRDLFDDRDGTTSPSLNPSVMAWNIAKSITLPDGSDWGFGFDADELPDVYWHAAMDEADVLVASSDNPPSQQTQYLAGLEIYMATPRDGGDDPATALDTVLAAASAEVCDQGGELLIRSGAPGLPVLSLTDNDILNSKDQSYQSFGSISETNNAVIAQYPHPGSRWNTVSSALRVDADAVAADGEQNPASIQLNAVPYSDQVERLLDAWLKDAQRLRTHTLYLPPSMDVLNVLDTIQLTSEVHNYTNKLFEVQEIEPDIRTGVLRVGIREVDPDDYIPGVYVGGPDDRPSRVVRDDIGIDTFAFSAGQITDGGLKRRPFVQFDYTHIANLLDGVNWTLSLDGEIVSRGFHQAQGSSSFKIYDGILPARTYEGTIQPVSGRFVGEFVAAQTAVSGPVYFERQDLSDATRADSVRLQRLEQALLDGTLAQTVRTEKLIESQANSSASIRNDLVLEVSEREALAASVTEISTTVDGNTATISESLLSQNGVFGQYAVVVDVNNRISGFGLISDLIDGVPESVFSVTADRFNIFTPDGDLPLFTFYASPTIVNGVERQGLYITGDLGITGDLIKDGVVSRVFFDEQSGTLSASATDVIVATATTEVQSGRANVDYQIEAVVAGPVSPSAAIQWEVEAFSTAFPAGDNTRILASGEIRTTDTLDPDRFASGTVFEGREVGPGSQFRIKLTEASGTPQNIDYVAEIQVRQNWALT